MNKMILLCNRMMTDGNVTKGNVIYNYVIVGAGPSGLALAQCLASLGKTIAIVEKEDDIGGCHRVRRVNGLFTEHGPRVYSTTYKVFQSLLKDMNLDFHDLFTPYNFTISNIGNETVWTVLSLRELSLIAAEFFFLLINNDHGLDMTIHQFMIKNQFAKESMDMIDRICRLTDGADATKYTLNEFLQLFNQQFFHTIYQPKMPNDNALFAKWKQHLIEKKVTFYLKSDVERIIYDRQSQRVSGISIRAIDGSSSRTIVGSQFILAIPPLPMVKLLEASDTPVRNTFGNIGELRAWAKDTAYTEYLSMTFHWDQRIDLPKIYGFPKTSWGVAYIVMTDYMEFRESESKTVISLAITIPDRPSEFTGKTADSVADAGELMKEALQQLRVSFPAIPDPTRMILSPGVYHDGARWISADTAFITSANRPYLSFRGSVANLYNVGTHNGHQIYKFTSMESAVTNAVKLAHEFHPELKTKYKIRGAFTVRQIILAIILIDIISTVLYYYVYKRDQRRWNRYIQRIIRAIRGK